MVARRGNWLARHDLKANLWHLAIGGAIIGYLTGIVVFDRSAQRAAVPVLRP